MLLLASMASTEVRCDGRCRSTALGGGVDVLAVDLDRRPTSRSTSAPCRARTTRTLDWPPSVSTWSMVPVVVGRVPPRPRSARRRAQPRRPDRAASAAGARSRCVIAAPSMANSSGSTVTPWSASFSRNFGRRPVDFERAHGPAVVVEARGVVEEEDVLQGDDVALHPPTSVMCGDPARAVLEAGLLDDQVDGAGDLLADGPHRQVHAGHQHHGLEAGERVARGVGVQGGDRAVVAGVHGLQHVEGGGVADLTDDDAVGAHAQEFFTRSRIVTAPLPSMLAGRDSSRRRGPGGAGARRRPRW